MELNYPLFLPLVFFYLLLVVPFWQIFRKAGYSPWLSMLMLVPAANLIALYFLAFATWPNSRGYNTD